MCVCDRFQVRLRSYSSKRRAKHFRSTRSQSRETSRVDHQRLLRAFKTAIKHPLLCISFLCDPENILLLTSDIYNNLYGFDALEQINSTDETRKKSSKYPPESIG